MYAHACVTSVPLGPLESDLRDVERRHHQPLRASQTASAPSPQPTSRAVPGARPETSATSAPFGSPLQIWSAVA